MDFIFVRCCARPSFGHAARGPTQSVFRRRSSERDKRLSQAHGTMFLRTTKDTRTDPTSWFFA